MKRCRADHYSGTESNADDSDHVSDNRYYYDLSRYARASVAADEAVIQQGRKFDMMVVDIESAMMKPDSDCMPSEERCACPQEQPSVPVYKLYGLTHAGSSVRVSVYGFFPFIHLRCNPVQSDPSWLEDIRAALETILEPLDNDVFRYKKSRQSPKRVLSVTCEYGYPIDEYYPGAINVLKVVLASPRYVRHLGSRFEAAGAKTQPLYTHRGCIEVNAFTCLEEVTQFQMETEIVGFGWVRIQDCCIQESDYDAPRTNLTFGASIYDIRALDERSICSGLRVMTYDIECANTAGFPVQGDSPIINIAIQTSDGINNTTGELLLQTGYADPVPDLPPDVLHLMFTPSGVLAREGGVDQLEPERSNTAYIHDPGEGIDAEVALLEAFGQFITTYDPDIIVGHNSNGFDNPYLLDRAHVLGVANAESLGRDRQHWRANRDVIKTRKNGEKTTSRRGTIPGRVQLDTMLVIKSDTTKRESSYGLNALSVKYLNGQTKEDVGHKLIAHMWKYSDYTRQRLMTYNRKDTLLTFGLFRHFGMIYDVIEMARATHLMPQAVLNRGQSAKVWAQLLHASKTPGWSHTGARALIPYETPHTRDAANKYAGATVLEPTTGWYNKQYVMVGDFRSLYPSMIIWHNICYSTLIRNKSVVTNEPIDASPVGCAYVKREARCGLLPRICERLLEARDVAKREMAAAKAAGDKIGTMIANSRQIALKVIANSVYGFTGASDGQFVRMQLSTSVTAWGRQMIELASTVAVNFGCSVLYGDTDSIMFIHPEIKLDLHAAFALLKRVCAEVTVRCGSTAVLLQPEKVYGCFLLQCKKHYAGLLYESVDAKPKLDMKGMETARRDYCEFVVQTLKDVLDAIMVKQDMTVATTIAHDAIAHLLRAEVDISSLIITRSLSRETYAVKQPHSDLMDRMEKRDPTFHRQTGDRIPYVIVNMPNRTIKLSEKAEDPLRVIMEDLPIDYNYYAFQQLKEPLIRLMAPVIGDAKHAENMFYSTNVLSTIKRISASISTTQGIGKYFKPRRACPSCQLDVPDGTSKYCDACISGGRMLQYITQIKTECADIETVLASCREKCMRCRGYDDPSIACQQKDCKTIYIVAYKRRRLDKLSEQLVRV
jgi:DNA polymerase delta subunit 1